MKKAKAERRATGGGQRRHATIGTAVMKLSPAEALDLLCPAFSPMEACRKLTEAIHDNRCRLECDGNVVKPHIAVDILVEPRLADDGRWTAKIVSASRQWWGEKFQWSLDTDEVKALLPEPKKAKRRRRKRRRKQKPSEPEKAKPGSADAWIDHVCPNGEWRLMTAKDILKKNPAGSQGARGESALLQCRSGCAIETGDLTQFQKFQSFQKIPEIPEKQTCG